MIRFGMKYESYTTEEGYAYFGGYSFCILILLVVESLFTSTFLLYSIVVLTISYPIGIAFWKLHWRYYEDTNFFLIDCIPVIGILMRVIEKFYNLYLLTVRGLGCIKKAYLEIDNAKMTQRLTNIARTNESITSKIELLQKDINTTEENEAIKRIYNDTKKTLNVLNRQLS